MHQTRGDIYTECDHCKLITLNAVVYVQNSSEAHRTMLALLLVYIWSRQLFLPADILVLWCRMLCHFCVYCTVSRITHDVTIL